MANQSQLQYIPNDLQPIKIDELTLRTVLDELRAAVRRGVDLILSAAEAPDITEQEAFGSIFSGSLGIGLMFLRLELQGHALSDYDPPLPEFRSLLRPHVYAGPLEMKLQPGRPSPLCSPSLGAAVIRILAINQESARIALGPSVEDDIAKLHEAIQIAINQDAAVTQNGHSMGGDEVLYGRAGLLWALASIDRHYVDADNAKSLQPVLELKQKLIDAIMDAGRNGRGNYALVHGEAGACPLMWPWIDSYYGIGAMHGVTGILTVLLGNELCEDDYRSIGDTITDLCKLCISHNGHLSMSIPPWPSSRPSPLVQICHGTPGLLLLLATAKGIAAMKKYQTIEWDEAIRLGTERVWEEGLLSKGGGLCHGIAGNAWPWLLLHEKFLDAEELAPKDTSASSDQTLTADCFLSKALAFLLAARDTKPFSTDSPSRMPDNPLSLFEGLAGTICAWAEGCAVITARLKWMEARANNLPSGPHAKARSENVRVDILGFPGLGGMGPNGLL